MNFLSSLSGFQLLPRSIPWARIFLLWLITVFLLSSISSPPGPDIPSPIPLDKIVHFLEYGVGAFLLLQALEQFPQWKARPLRTAALAIGVISAIGALDEAYQTLTPGRYGLDPFDWLADFSGAFCVALAWALRLKL